MTNYEKELLNRNVKLNKRLKLAYDKIKQLYKELDKKQVIIDSNNIKKYYVSVEVADIYGYVKKVYQPLYQSNVEDIAIAGAYYYQEKIIKALLRKSLAREQIIDNIAFFVNKVDTNKKRTYQKLLVLRNYEYEDGEYFERD